MSKTVIVWDECGQNGISFVVIDGDVTHLAGVYINRCGNDRDAEDALTDLIYGADGRHLYRHMSEFPVEEVKAGASVIVCGFLP
ncbi:hypothetical protein BTI_1576 [Burkholderia thailandensis MSMB121]|uniref:hypothetical protein n=1 Tax=Burkholderia humptydooensis TaxID=430531 RepID=UPI000327F045|nr:hypothetical protein [Burkholderia humptydooensis]AGK47124.1 hypothetical protein BTI_1576 [Burkholderia thailandensis MSMB121]ATF36658.1 hypothetical protein CO709_27585 [Burkholderia thailandensis]KST74036.1 hypothetical protein WS76_07625 [Burkholderia humptydooensis]